MKKLIATLPFIFTVIFIFARTGTIKGTVLDQPSEMPVIGATVQLLSTVSHVAPDVQHKELFPLRLTINHAKR